VEDGPDQEDSGPGYDDASHDDTAEGGSPLGEHEPGEGEAELPTREERIADDVLEEEEVGEKGSPFEDADIDEDGLVHAKVLTNGEGLTNGSGMTNGEGLTNGSGMTNGKGFTNGDGMTNGEGLTNGDGMTNGKGLTNGDGMTNGKGLTNGDGMTNGKGLTNGEGGARRAIGQRRKGSSTRTLVVVLMAFVLLITPVLLLYSGLFGVEEDRILVDGSFDDWEGISTYTDTEGDAGGAGQVDLVSWQAHATEDYIAARVVTAGRFSGYDHLGKVGDVALHLMVDEDGDAATGYRVSGIGADLMVTVTAGSGGAMTGAVTLWDEDWRTGGAGARSGDDWHGWMGASGTVEVASDGRDLELKAMVSGIPEDASMVIATADAFGRGDVTDVPFSSTRPTLLVQQWTLEGSALVGEERFMEVSLTAHGGKVTVTSLSLETEGMTITKNMLELPLEVNPGNRQSARPYFKAEGAMPGTFLSAEVRAEDVDAGDALVVVMGHPARTYAISPPPDVVVDGAFGDWMDDWDDLVIDNPEDVVLSPYAPSNDPGVDLSAVSAQMSADSLDLLAMVSGGMLKGVSVPFIPRSIPLGAIDVDGDGRWDLNGDRIEEGYGTRDDDWDNDDGLPDDPGTEFVDTGTDEVDEDDDNDGIPDWNDLVKGGTAIPGPPTTLPPLEGRDTVEFLIDSDGVIATGYSPDGYLLGADHRVVVIGREGTVLEARLEEHSGGSASSWSWNTLSDLEVGIGDTLLEVAVDRDSLDATGNLTIIVRAVGWAGSKDWSDQLLEGDLAVSDDIGSGRGVGAIDPYAVAQNGSFSISPTGTAWTQKDGPSDLGAFIDIAVGDGTTAGYVFALTTEGNVMVTTNALTGWTEYGQGTPGKPASSAYVAIATGRGNLVGYVYILRNDGAVFVCDRATNGWSLYGQGPPAIPASTSYVDLAPGGEGLEGYVYTLRRDGNVYVTDSAVNGWTLYGQGIPAAPSSHPDYVALATGDRTTRGYVFMMRGTGEVYVATSAVTGWTRYAPGTPVLPSSEGFTDMDAGNDAHPGRVVIARRDGHSYLADSAVGGWARYGLGTPPLPTGVGYTGIALGAGRLPGYVYQLSEDGKVYVCDNALRGWARYGQGTPVMPPAGGHSAVVGSGGGIFLLALKGSVSKSTDDGDTWSPFGTVDPSLDGWVSLAEGIDGNLYALRRDGTVRTSGMGTSSWSSHGDAGDGLSWRSMTADDNGYLYALRSDGVTAYATTASSTWTSKGDVGDGNAWVDMAALDGSGHVYAMRSDRAISRATAGTSTTWSTWSSADTEFSWVSVASSGTHLLALRADGRVDMATLTATPTWTNSLADVGEGTGWEDLSIPIPEVTSLMAQVMLTLMVIFGMRRRLSASCTRGSDIDESTNNGTGVD